MAAFREAVALAPERLDALTKLSIAYLRIGQPAQAIPGLRKAQQAAPQHPGIGYFLGLALFQSSRFAEARAELSAVLERQPSNSQALHLYGLCLLKLDELERGIQVLEEVVQSAPGNRQALYTLGSAYIKTGQADRAGELVSNRLQDDETPEALLIKGSLHLANKQYGDALALLERAGRGSEALPMVHSQIGVALLYEGRRERAAEAFRTELAGNPLDFNANAFLGWLLQQNGEAEQALQLLQTAHGLNESDTGVQYLLAQAHSSRGSWSEVETLLKEVIQAQPAFIPAHVMLARAYAKLKRTELFRRQQAIIKQLNEQQQERDLLGVDHLYDGTVLSMPKR